ncbi:MAG: hypothetical protein KJ906_04325 [Nanoarchaeota archaeon]|nr:hypothetical protein [Nanoarchaeota archaeon]
MKEFLKPTKWKNILSFLIFLIFPAEFHGFCLAYVGAYCPDWTFFGGFQYLIEFFVLIVSGMTSKMISFTSYFNDALNILPAIIMMFFVSYIISSIIIHLYERRKKK